MEPWTSPVFSQGELRMTKNHRSSVAMPLALALIAACGGAASSPPPDRSAAKEAPSTTSFKAPPTVESSTPPAPSPPPPEPKAEEPPPKPASNASDALWAAAKREQQESIDAAVVRLDAELTKLERTKQPWTVNEVNKTAETGNTIIDLRKRSEDPRLKALWSRWAPLRVIAARTQEALVAKCKSATTNSQAKCESSRHELRTKLQNNVCFHTCRGRDEREEDCFDRCVMTLEEKATYVVFLSSCVAAMQQMMNQGGGVDACEPR